MGLTLDPIVRTLFLIFICVLTIYLVVLMIWGLAFLYQQELSPNVIFAFDVFVPIGVDYKGGLAIKYLIFFPNMEPSFIVIVIV